MKKIIFTLIAAMLVSSASFAQFNQGRILAGGNITFSSTTQKEESGSTEVTIGKTTSFSFAPQVGYFVVDNVAIGAELLLSTLKFKPEDDTFFGESTTTSIAFSPFVRYYVNPGIFFQGSIGFGSAKNEDKEGNVTFESEENLFLWSLGAGYAIFLNDNVAIEPQLTYRNIVSTEKDSDPEQKTKLGSFLIGVGIQVYLDPK